MPETTITETTIFSAPAGEREPNYPRLLHTDPDGPHAGALLLIFDYGLPDPAGLLAFPVYRSDDGGVTWAQISQIRDTALGVGHRFQPTLYELPAAVGGFAAGTILAAGNAIPDDMSRTHLVLYASTDGARTWQFLSVIDSGGPAVYDPGPESTTSAVWEPELELIGGQLVCLYSDERYKDRGMLQVLVHRTSTDLRTWSEPVLDFGVPDRLTRPGMLVTTPALPDGRVLGVLELVGPPGVPVHLVSSPDGLRWTPADNLGTLLESVEGTRLSGTPNISWTRPPGADHATVLVTGRIAVAADGAIRNVALVNRASGHGDWHEVPLPVAATVAPDDPNAGYSQTLLLSPDGRTLVQSTSRRNAAGNLDIVVGTAPAPAA
ncbi:sialidase family protein [Phytohabitans sp. LJ34]|uniref:sialidase family protein n=1 Tax=Phytohabitans sp. LJ34 TaxID=3452217 RepID=UPI003F89D1F3